MCGYPHVQEHHIFGGTANRKLSEQYGLKVYLCYMHHLDSRDGVHFDPWLAEQLHKEGQRAFEKTYPELNFRQIFGKNYL